MEQEKLLTPYEESSHLPRTVVDKGFLGVQAQLGSGNAVYQGGR